MSTTSDEPTVNHALALEHALSFEPGELVHVGSPRYRGPGTISRRTYYDSHIVWLDASGIMLAVRIGNGNIWFYPALDVYHLNGHPTAEAPK